jgi:rSAM/selenodomain-associated transferase 2
MERLATSSVQPRPSRVSVIVPVLDEAGRIEGQLRSLACFAAFHEVIVVDGGSRDDTVALVRAAGAARLVHAPRGRASQMNAGARVATGDVLLFLHADVRLPDDAIAHVEEALADASVVAGAFRTWTVPDAGRSWLAPFLHLADLRSRCSRLPYGDQALFVRADAFRRAGGFPDQPLMEDVELARRLARLGRLRVVRSRVEVSGRRFLARPIYYTLAVNLFPALYALGVAPATLKRLYGDPR